MDKYRINWRKANELRAKSIEAENTDKRMAFSVDAIVFAFTVGMACAVLVFLGGYNSAIQEQQKVAVNVSR